MAETLLELRGISKTYPGVRALDDVNLRVYRGEVLGLIGENGAGKSTLMRVLGGVVAPSEGVISIDGNDHVRMTVSGATRAGIAFVHQELNLFENLDVAANVAERLHEPAAVLHTRLERVLRVREPRRARAAPRPGGSLRTDGLREPLLDDHGRRDQHLSLIVEHRGTPMWRELDRYMGSL